MKARLNNILLFIFLGGSWCFGANSSDEMHGKIEVKRRSDSLCSTYMRDSRIYSYGLDTLQNIKFWRAMIKLDPDSGYVNVGSTRQILATIPVARFKKMSSAKAQIWRDSIRKQYQLPDSEHVVFSAGKADFYKFDKVMPTIADAIAVFEENNTDPFYAQAILLIESPGQLQKSYVGAYGPFQLMKGVARNMGLTVNKYADDRKDLSKSAWAAAKLIRTICIPYTNAMLDAKGICYNEKDLWYRLLVLHVYHAGAGNVEKALNKIDCCEENGSMELIKKLWNTTAGAFGPASQNYSQVALACLIELDQMIDKNSAEIFWMGE